MEIKQSFIDVGRPNRPGFAMEPRFITIHNTDNTDPGADAYAHARYLQTTDRKVSWHFTVDDAAVYQHLPLNETGYHAGDGGDGPGNRTSIGIEICMHQGIDQNKANWLAIDLIVYLLKTLGLGVEAVVPHKKWTGKNCPALIIPWWDHFLVSVQSKMSEPGPAAWDPAGEIARLKERGIIHELREPDQTVKWGELAAVINRVLERMG